MRSTHLKKIKDVDTRRPLAPSRLIKCYVCNQHFDSQPAFESHLKLHKTKLDREEVDQLQRKTQESFRKSKHGTALHKTMSAVPKEGKGKVQKKEVKKESQENMQSEKEKREEREDEEEEERLQEALRESTILLEKIQMITEPAFDEEKPLAEVQQEENQPVAKFIEGSKELYDKLRKTKEIQLAEEFIIGTAFESKDLQNYQEQLVHLRSLLGYAVNPKSIDQINQIKRRICEDVSAQLRSLYEQQTLPSASKNDKIEVQERTQLREGTGQEVLFCSECYGQLVSYEEYWHCGGQSYHRDCYAPQ